RRIRPAVVWRQIMKANAQRVGDGFKHTVTVGSHKVTVDEPESNGGSDRGPNPQEMLAVSLASCTAITIEMYAKRKGWDIGDVADAALAQERLETGCLEAGVALGARVLALVDDHVDARAVERLVKLGAGRVLDAVHRPDAALLGERSVVRRVPVARRHDQLEA